MFLSLSLSVFIGFVLLLTGNAIRNAGKIRFECASDVGMNSVLAEFCIALQERYELFYIDASYLNKNPSVSNIEDRLRFYMSCNLKTGFEEEPWERVSLDNISVTEVISAASGMGKSMKYQAAKYIEDSGITREEANIFSALEGVGSLGGQDALQEWNGVQEVIAGIELPVILNEKGEWEEVPLSNPADAIYELTSSDILYLLELNMENIGVGRIHKEEYISERQIKNMTPMSQKDGDDELFLNYLWEKMGSYRAIREDSLLQFQLEYIAEGEASDYENLKAVAERLLKWRFAINAAEIFENSGFREEASDIAYGLYAVILKPEFAEPVTDSILYACAYLESLAEVKTLLNGGRISLEKNGWNTAIEQVLTGEYFFAASDEEGFNYEQYLSCMVMLLPENIRNLRCMDIMEMDIRALTGNSSFAMDWCIERYRARISGSGAIGEEYRLERTYGYYS